jgi:hypothetical protein
VTTDPIAVYVSDHLAGSVAALELIDVLANHERGRPLEDKLRTLATEITEEQATLREALARVAADESRVKQAAAWLGEKVTRGKLFLADRSNPDLALLLGLEALALGLQGKLALSRALGDAATYDPRLAGLPFGSLEARTLIQHAMIEHERMEAARAAFGGKAAGASRG